MSFSTIVKNEIISKEYNYRINANDAKAELLAFVLYGGKLKCHDAGFLLKIKTENAKIARRIYSLLRETVNIKSFIKIHKNTEKNVYYEVRIENSDEVIKLYSMLKLVHYGDNFDKISEFKIPNELIRKSVYKRAFVKGAFLACGSVMSPQKNYHLEFAAPTMYLAQVLANVLTTFDINSKIIERKSKYVLYFKSSDTITDILSAVEAINSLTEFHNAKIVKGMRNSINRTMNCENANMDKTVDASMQQVICINKLIENGIFDDLPESLKEIAIIRLENRESSLKELGEMLDPPIGKSGVNHRLRKLQKLAEKY